MASVSESDLEAQIDDRFAVREQEREDIFSKCMEICEQFHLSAEDFMPKLGVAMNKQSEVSMAVLDKVYQHLLSQSHSNSAPNSKSRPIKQERVSLITHKSSGASKTYTKVKQLCMLQFDYVLQFLFPAKIACIEYH
jgi:hypothetical protein